MNPHIQSCLEFVAILILAPIVNILPCFKKKVVFGAWLGKQFSDNPKYFMKFLIDNTDYKCYWIGDEVLRKSVSAHPGVTFLRRGSIAAAWHLVTARWIVCNIHWDGDIMRFPTYGRCKCLNFWHGTALKKIGEIQYNGSGVKTTAIVNQKKSFISCIKELKHRIETWAIPSAAYATCANERMIDILHRSCPPRFVAERTIVAGQPRNDFLIQNMNNEVLKKELKDKYGKLFNLPTDKKWYLYMPTWRHDLKDTFSFLRAEMKAELQKILEDQGAILIEKQHPIVLKQMDLQGCSEGRIYALASKDNSMVDMQELLLISDRLITDYSSCFFDFEVMKRPSIHFAYDYEDYAQRDSGVEYELRDIAAGPIATTEAEFINYFRLSDNEILAMRGPYADETIAGETGHACEQFAKWMGMI